MRSTPSVLHLDLDAFFASVEQRDKPSLRGRPVIVGGVGGRGVVATASYEARAYGARSAMATAEARRRCPAGTAFLSPRSAAYRDSSQLVMSLLAEVSPLVEQVSIDEAYVDLAAVSDADLTVEGVSALGQALRRRIRTESGGLTASVGIGSSKLVAKIASELDKPDGLTVVAPGAELATLHPLPVRRLGGVGPATAERLRRLHVETIGDLAAVAQDDLVSLLGQASGTGLHRLSLAMDDRPVVPEREAKSVSAEETFGTDLTDPALLRREIERLAERVGTRLRAAATYGRTVTLKVRRYDFSTVTRSSTLPQSTDAPRQLVRTAVALLQDVDVSGGVRLLGLGMSGLSDYVQDDLFADAFQAGTADGAEAERVKAEPAPGAGSSPGSSPPTPLVAGSPSALPGRTWRPGQDVAHRDHGPGWVWGSGRGLVTVRFEGPATPPGPVRTFAVDDPALQPGDPPFPPSATHDDP
jgi:DNA polymerase-4